MNGLLDWKMRDEKEGDGRPLRIDCLFNAQSIQPLYLSLSVLSPPLSHSLIHMQVSCEQVRGEKKSNRKSDCSGKRRKIEHPPLLCQSVSSVKHCSVCCSPHGVHGPFHLTWLCKRLSQRPKGGECQGLDKVPSICLMGPAGRRARWGRGEGKSLRITEYWRKSCGCEGQTQGRVRVYACLATPLHS